MAGEFGLGSEYLGGGQGRNDLSLLPGFGLNAFRECGK